MRPRRDCPSGAFSCREKTAVFTVQGRSLGFHSAGRSFAFRSAESSAAAFAVTENKLLTGKGINGTLRARADFVKKSVRA